MNIRSILTTSIAAIALCSLGAPAFAADDKQAEKKTDTQTTSTSSSSSSSTVDGKTKSTSSTVITTPDGKRTKIVISSDSDTPIITVTDVNDPAQADKPGKHRPVTRLGVAADPVDDELAAHLPLDPGTGLVIRNVVADSPAAKAGLVANDVLVKIDDQILVHPKQLQTLIRNRKAGDKVEVTYLRKGERHTASATLDQSTELSDGRPGFFHKFGGEYGLDGKTIGSIVDAISGAAHRGKALFLGPDGKVAPIEEGKIEERIIEELRKANIPDDVRKSIEKSIAQAREAAERARETAERAAKAAEESARRSLEEARRAAEEARREIERSLKKDKSEKPDQNQSLEKTPGDAKP